MVLEGGRLVEKTAYSQLSTKVLTSSTAETSVVGSQDQAKDLEPESGSQEISSLPPSMSSVDGKDVTRDATADSNRGNGNWSVYLYYCQAAGWTATIVTLTSMAVESATNGFSSESHIRIGEGDLKESSGETSADIANTAIWIQLWSNANDAQPNKDASMYLGVYAVIFVATSAGLLIACWYVLLSEDLSR